MLLEDPGVMANLMSTARWLWWILTGLCFGMALCGFLYREVPYFIGGMFGVCYFTTLNLLPDRVFWKRAKR